VRKNIDVSNERDDSGEPSIAKAIKSNEATDLTGKESIGRDHRSNDGISFVEDDRL